LLDKGINIGKAETGKDKQALVEVAKNKPGTTKVKDYLKSAGISVKGEIVVTGEIGFEQHIQYNVLTKQHNIKDIIGNSITTRSDEKLFKAQISFNAEITGNLEKEFNFFTLQAQIEGKLKVELKGSLAMKLKYGINPDRGMYIQPTLVFSGLKGIYSGNYKTKTKYDDDVIAEKSVIITPTPFTLIEPFELDLLTMQMFDKDKPDW
jgi:hypothetical protein